MPVILQNEFADIVIGDDGRNLHVVDRATGRDYAVHSPPSSFVAARRDGVDIAPTALTLEAGVMTVSFGDTDATARIGLEEAERHFVFTVVDVTGDIDELHFVNLPTTLPVTADEPFSAGVLALNLQTNVEELPGPQQHLWAACYRRFGFEGAQAGLAACPYAVMREVLKDLVAAAPGVPHSQFGGPWAMDRDEPMGSYLFGTPTEETVDDWIDLCRRLNFNQIDFCGCLNYGDYQPFPHMYPDGYASVKAVTDRLHNAGILAGLHTMSFSINKKCSWVTPVPDTRLAKERSYTLATDLDEANTVVPLVESTAHLPRHVSYYVRRSMVLQIDDELIQYTLVEDQGGDHAVAGCTRGAYGTHPAPHAKGARVHHLKECWGCFLPDGESTLFDEVANRIASVINQCGFDFTYLDGLDGAHVIGGEENRWHYGSKFAFEVYRRLDRPTMMEMATFHHHLWFVRSRMQAWDHTIRGHKTFIDLHCRSNEGCRRIFMPRHLGWSRVLAWVDSAHDVTFDDDVEYMWCKGLANDSGYSLQVVNPQMVAAEPWVDQVMPIIKTYETLRREKSVPESIKEKLREPGAEFTIRQAEDGKWEFLPKQVTRHKVEGLDTSTCRWSVENQFDSQPLTLRIQALMSAGPYDDPDNVVLAGFTDGDEFHDREPTRVILNSGKVYSYPAAAPGLSATLVPDRDTVRAEGISGRWQARNAGLAQAIPSSTPHDDFSLLDHAERIYRPQRASWVRLGKRFNPPLDLGNRKALAFWVHGDAQNELINVRIGTPSDLDTTEFDFYIPVDFSGWRYVELIEPESERCEQYSWPFGRSLYKQYRERLDFGNIGRLNLWYNNVPAGGAVTCLLSPIKAVPVLPNRICRPAITVGDETVVFPVDIESGCYLEYRGAEDCKLFSPKRELIAAVSPEGSAPILKAGENTLAFDCAASEQRARANITVFAHGRTSLRS